MIAVMEKKKLVLNEEMKQLVQEHIHLVKKIASKIAIFLPRHIDSDDLIHEGLMGLMDAAFKYDSKMGMTFSSYATIRVKGAILDSLRSMDWIPRRVRKMAKIIEKAREELVQTLGRTPSRQELAEKLNIPIIKLSSIMSAVEQAQIISFEDLQNFSNRYYVPEDKTHPLTVEDESSDYDKVEMKAVLKSALMELKERERLVLSLYYLEDLNLKEIKMILDISEARISQIHTAALKKLKSKLKGTVKIKETVTNN